MATEIDELDGLLPGDTTSYRIVEMVRRRIGTEYVRASDTAVGKAIGVSRAAIHAYKTGKDVMTQERFLEINSRLLSLPDDQIAEVLVDLVTDASSNDQVREAWESIKESLITAKRIASVLLAALALLGVSALPSQHVAAHALESLARSVYYVKLARWLRRHLGRRPPVHPHLELRSVTAPAF